MNSGPTAIAPWSITTAAANTSRVPRKLFSESENDRFVSAPCWNVYWVLSRRLQMSRVTTSSSTVLGIADLTGISATTEL